MKKGKATDNVKRSLKEIERGYLPTRCFIDEGKGYVETSCNEIIPLLRRGKMEKSIKVCNDRLGKCIALEKGEEINVLDFEGAEVYLTKDECDNVDRWEKIGYIISSKGEGRTIKTPFKGQIVLIEEVFGEKADHYRIYLRKVE